MAVHGMKESCFRAPENLLNNQHINLKKKKRKERLRIGLGEMGFNLGQNIRLTKDDAIKGGSI